MRYAFRPLPAWPDPDTEDRRSRYTPVFGRRLSPDVLGESR